ncbi:MAG TPA: hypothetical protein VF768_05355 [Holophagaceae bacterium]
MRLNEREAIQRRNRGVVTMEDMERDRRAREAQERRRGERERREAKAATRGPALLEVADE